jgi:hypothetical protein
MPFDPQEPSTNEIHAKETVANPGQPPSITSDASPFAPHRVRVFSEPQAPPPEVDEPRPPPERTWENRPEYAWRDEYRAGLPYWQQRDPVPPQPAEPPELETPGETLSERQEAFCRAYVEHPVAAGAARVAGYSPAAAARQASRLLKHPLIVRRIYELRDVKGKDHQVRRDTIIDQAEAVFEAAMEKGDYYAAMQALTMKARLAGFADYLPGVRILRRAPSEYEMEFWARMHESEQKLTALRFGEFAGGPVDRRDILEAKAEAESRAEFFGALGKRHAANKRSGGKRPTE